MIVVEEHGARRGLGPFDGGDRGAVEEIDVEPAVVVVVEKSDAGAGSVDDGGFFRGAGTMVKLVEAGLVGDVDEDHGSAIDEAASGDGAGVGILNGGVNTARGHSGGPGNRNVLRLVGSSLCGLPAESKLREG